MDQHTLDILYAVFIAGEEAESAIAYDKLCEAGVKLDDVATHVSGNEWVTNYGNHHFSITPDE